LCLVEEIMPTASSRCVYFLQDNFFVNSFVVRHVRRATSAGTALRNWRPQVREFGRVELSIAYAGELGGVERNVR